MEPQRKNSMMKIKIKKVAQLFIILMTSAGLSLFFCTYNTRLNEVGILNDEIIISLLSGLLVLSIAIITLIYTLIERIRAKLRDNKNIGLILDNLFSALKKDTWAIFVFLTITVLIILFRDTDIPKIMWSNALPFTKNNFIFFVKMFVTFLSLSAIADIILTLFALLAEIRQVKD